MKLVLYCSNSVWPVKRKMHKKQIFLVGADSALRMYYPVCRRGRAGENVESLKEMNFALGVLPEKGTKARSKYQLAELPTPIREPNQKY